MKHVIVLNAGLDRSTFNWRLAAVEREALSPTDIRCVSLTPISDLDDLLALFPTTKQFRGLSADGTFSIKVAEYEEIMRHPEALHDHWSSPGVEGEIEVKEALQHSV